MFTHAQLAQYERSLQVNLPQWAISRPNYSYVGEVGINPFYESLETGYGYKLCPGIKKIWALRGDSILATGIKNGRYNRNIAEYRGLPEVMDDCKEYSVGLNREVMANNLLTNRYGHPSLAVPEGSYTGGAYAGGWVYQNETGVYVMYHCGRFNNRARDPIIEKFLAFKFMTAYSEAKQIIFIDGANNMDDFFSYYAEKLPANHPRRVYPVAAIEREIQLTIMPERLTGMTRLEVKQILNELKPAEVTEAKLKLVLNSYLKTPPKHSNWFFKACSTFAKTDKDCVVQKVLLFLDNKSTAKNFSKNDYAALCDSESLVNEIMQKFLHVPRLRDLIQSLTKMYAGKVERLGPVRRGGYG
jgi:hypothetical protein